jgi:outer membrane lipopolysaccharide assembly protein LptE/RlpB
MKTRLILLLIVLLFQGGCGYHAPGQGDAWVGREGKTLFIELFANRTAEPYLDNFMTEMVVRQLSRSRYFEITEDRPTADLVLAGTVVGFDSKALAYGSDDRIAEYRASLQVDVRLITPASGDVLWQDALRRSEDYPATIDKNLQLEGRSLAARQAAERLAEDLYVRLLDAF